MAAGFSNGLAAGANMKFSVHQDRRRYYRAKFRLGSRQFVMRLKATNKEAAVLEARIRLAVEVESHEDEWLAKPRRGQAPFRTGLNTAWMHPWRGRAGVYAIASGCGRFFKIGKAIDIGKRFERMQVDHPLKLFPIGLLSANTRDEKRLMWAFADKQVRQGGNEWFHLDDESRARLDAIVTPGLPGNSVTTQEHHHGA